MIGASREVSANSNSVFAGPKLAVCLGILLFSVLILAPLAAQDESQNHAGPASCVEGVATAPAKPSPASPGETIAAPHTVQPGQTAHPAAYFVPEAPIESTASPADAAQPICSAPAAVLHVSRYFSAHYFSLDALADSASPQDSGATALTTPSKYPVSPNTGKWGGEQWRPAILQALGFTLMQNGYRYATEEKTRRAIDLETWHSYYEAISGLHTWSDGGKTWTVYVAHPAQGAVFEDMWTEHDPHGVLVPFGFNHPYWASKIKAFWWNAAWELQWKFGPFSEASIGNVGLIPGKLGANTIVSTVTIGTGLAIGEDALDRYGIAKWEKKTNNIYVRALLRTVLNPDRGFANLFRAHAPWYRDTRHTLRDLAP